MLNFGLLILRSVFMYEPNSRTKKVNVNKLFIVTIFIYIVIIIFSSVIVFPGLADHYYYYANAMLQNNGFFISDLNDTQMFDKNAETSVAAVNHIDNDKLHNNNDNITVASHAHISTAQYDQIKNCAIDLDKRPTSIEYLTYFNCGRVSENKDSGQTVREFTLIVQENSKVPISYEGHIMDAWTFNGTVPGPTMRMTEDDLVKITVINSKDSKHPHSLHMHSIHSSDMDGVEGAGGVILPGKSFTYEFVAQPYGVYPYHCHVNPVADHINRGLYGMMIIDPKEPREKMTELVMTMNGYDMDYDMEGPRAPPSMAEIRGEEDREEEKERDNEIYTVNGKAFDYMDNPIPLNVKEKYRIYLLNMVEFDLINSFHLHGDMISYIPGGTQYEATQVNDVI